MASGSAEHVVIALSPPVRRRAALLHDVQRMAEDFTGPRTDHGQVTNQRRQQTQHALYPRRVGADSPALRDGGAALLGQARPASLRN
jgi:hypothetical protein